MELKKYDCKLCYYSTSHKSHYDKHLLTKKHKDLTNPIKNMSKPNTKETYICQKCNKTYKHSSSLSFHKRNCEDNKEDSLLYKDIILHLVKENNEYKELLIEQSRENKQLIQKNQEETKNMLLEMMKSI